ncbi:MAG: FkbM family methyltransferase [Paracoccus sp. (in: a-proteobacteria)]|nr:FkbM family methyltransferase [Paracoccus sp. (in: a-proteobacteria)]
MAQENPTIEALEAQIRKIRRRSAKLQRAAWAGGLLDGVAAMLRPGDIVLDCGANLGEITAKLAPSGATIHAFEPDPDCFAHLGTRFADQPNVVLHNAAVGARADRLSLFRGTSQSGALKDSSVKNTLLSGGRGVDEANSVTVDVIDLPAFIAGLLDGGQDLRFLKIDIEGAEVDLLNKLHADGLLNRIGMTVAETHEKKFRHMADDFAALRQMVAAHYKPTHVNLEWI